MSAASSTADDWRRSRAGAISARGYHYQDAVLTWMLCCDIADEIEVADLVPEGFDDATCLLAGLPCQVQVKSRQEHRGPAGAGVTAAWLSELYQRHRERFVRDPGLRLVLVCERAVAQTGLAATVADTAPISAGVHRLGDPALTAASTRMHVLEIPDPVERSVQMLSRARDLREAVARLAVQALLAVVTAAVDANAEASASPSVVGRTDAERIVANASALVDTAQLEEVLRSGCCEPVDFTAGHRPGRYLLGAATTPADVAGSEVADRPERVAEAAAALEDGRRLLILGPSGQGKSALAWLTVHATRHVVRWYRVSDLEDGAPAKLDRFARVLEATPERPVGFVVDDVGRLGASRWDDLVFRARERPGVMLLGTCREEDASDSASLADVATMRPTLDAALAEALWARLREQKATDWPGWREPLEASGGLTLEYTHLLVSGKRLQSLVDAQIGARVRAHDGAALAVLRTACTADLLAAPLTVPALAAACGLPPTDVSLALPGLWEEFLMQDDESRITGLHELRSRAVAETVHRLMGLEMSHTLEAVLSAVDAALLPVVVPRAAAGLPAERLVAALERRLRADLLCRHLGQALEGLRNAELSDAGENAAAELQRLPPGEIADTIRSRLGGLRVYDSQVITLGGPDLSLPAASLRERLASNLADVGVDRLDGLDEPEALAAVLDGFDGTSWIAAQTATALTAAAAGTPSDADPMRLLDVARAAGASVHAAVVAGCGGPAAALATIAARGRLGLGPPVGGTLHRVVDRDGREWWRPAAKGGLVDAFAALAGDHELATVLVDEFGRPLPKLDWGPDPPASTSPGAVAPVVQHRREAAWRGILFARVGTPRYTDRLDAEVALLVRLTAVLPCLVVSAASRRPPARSNDRELAAVAAAAGRLPPQPGDAYPTDADDPGVGAHTEADAALTLLRDPARLLAGAISDDPARAYVMAYRLWRVACDLVASGRWSLTADPDPAFAAAAAIARTLYAVRAVCGEVVLGSMTVRESLRTTSVKAPADVRESRLLQKADQESDRRLRSQGSRLQSGLRDDGIDASVHIAADADEAGKVWPPGAIAVIVELDDAREWTSIRDRVVDSRVKYADESRIVYGVARVYQRASDLLSGEAARAWWPRRGVPALLGLQTSPEPRGEAWEDAIGHAARLRQAAAHQSAVSGAGASTSTLFENERRQQNSALDQAVARLNALGAGRAAALALQLSKGLSPNLIEEADAVGPTLTQHDLRAL